MIRTELLKIAKPILFNTEMVQAILDDRKTVTRRAVKPCISHEVIRIYEDKSGIHFVSPTAGKPCNGTDVSGTLSKPKYRKGDYLYVRETFCQLWKLDSNDQIIEGTEKYYYAADGYNPTPFNFFPDEHGFGGDRNCPKWKPSIHMPKEAARIFLRVTDVRVERLQQITEEQIKKEGIVVNKQECAGKFDYVSELYCLFQQLWDSTTPKKHLSLYGWEANPFVWIYEFERAKCDE